MKTCFENKEFYIGIDVHKKRRVITVRTYDHELKTYSMDVVIPVIKIVCDLCPLNY